MIASENGRAGEGNRCCETGEGTGLESEGGWLVRARERAVNRGGRAGAIGRRSDLVGGAVRERSSRRGVPLSGASPRSRRLRPSPVAMAFVKPNKTKAYFKRFQVKYKRRRGEAPCLPALVCCVRCGWWSS